MRSGGAEDSRGGGVHRQGHGAGAAGFEADHQRGGGFNAGSCHAPAAKLRVRVRAVNGAGPDIPRPRRPGMLAAVAPRTARRRRVKSWVQ